MNLSFTIYLLSVFLKVNLLSLGLLINKIGEILIITSPVGLWSCSITLFSTVSSFWSFKSDGLSYAQCLHRLLISFRIRAILRHSLKDPEGYSAFPNPIPFSIILPCLARFCNTGHSVFIWIWQQSTCFKCLLLHRPILYQECSFSSRCCFKIFRFLHNVNVSGHFSITALYKTAILYLPPWVLSPLLCFILL